MEGRESGPWFWDLGEEIVWVMEDLGRVFCCLLFHLHLQLIAWLLICRRCLSREEGLPRRRGLHKPWPLCPSVRCQSVGRFIFPWEPYSCSRKSHMQQAEFAIGLSWASVGRFWILLFEPFSWSHVKIFKKDFSLWNVFNLKANVLIAGSEKPKILHPSPPKKTKSNMQIPLK